MAKRSTKRHASKTKSQQQVRFLLSKGSPLTEAQKAKLKRELKGGKVKIVKRRR